MNKYLVSLTNKSGATFDNEIFTNLKMARAWAAGRGQTFDNGKWNDYIVRIYKNNEMDPMLEYKTR